MDGGQIIRRTLRVAEEIDATVVIATGSSPTRMSEHHGKVRMDHEDDCVLVGDEMIDVESVWSVLFSRGG